MRNQQFQDFMVNVDLTHLIMQMVSPYLKRINHFYQFQIMSGLVLLTRSKSISYDFPILHKHVIKPLIQSININNKDSRTIRDSEH